MIFFFLRASAMIAASYRPLHSLGLPIASTLPLARHDNSRARTIGGTLSLFERGGQLLTTQMLMRLV